MALNQSQVSALYVSLFGRASEGTGSKYWQEVSKANNWGFEKVANEMLKTQAAKDFFGNSMSSDEAFIAHIYATTLNKSAGVDEEGKAFWVKALKEGRADKGTIASELLKSALSTKYAGDKDPATKAAHDLLVNKIIASNVISDITKDIPAGKDIKEQLKSFVEINELVKPDSKVEDIKKIVEDKKSVLSIDETKLAQSLKDNDKVKILAEITNKSKEEIQKELDALNAGETPAPNPDTPKPDVPTPNPDTPKPDIPAPKPDIPTPPKPNPPTPPQPDTPKLISDSKGYASIFKDSDIKFKLEGITKIYRVGDKLYKDSVAESNLINSETTKIESFSSSNYKTEVLFKNDPAYPSIKETPNKNLNDIILSMKDKISEIRLLDEASVNNLKSIANDLKGSLGIHVDLAQHESTSGSIDLSTFQVNSFIFGDAESGHGEKINNIKTGQGDDNIDVSALSAANITIDAGNGNDTVVANLAQTSKLVLSNVEKLRLKDTNSSNDTIDVSALNVANIEIDAGEGDDTVVANLAQASKLVLKNVEQLRLKDALNSNFDMDTLNADDKLVSIELNEATQAGGAITNIKQNAIISLNQANAAELTLDNKVLGALNVNLNSIDMQHYIKLGNNVNGLTVYAGAENGANNIKLDGSEIIKFDLTGGKTNVTTTLDMGANIANLRILDASAFEGNLNFIAKAGHTADIDITTGQGDDTIDISALGAAGKFVDVSKGGNDKIIVKSGVDASSPNFATIIGVNAGDKIVFNGVDAANGNIVKHNVAFNTDLKTTINNFLASNPSHDTANTIYMLNITGSNKDTDNGVYLIHNKNGSSAALTNDDSIVKLNGTFNSAVEADGGIITLSAENPSTPTPPKPDTPELISDDRGYARIFKDSSVNFKLEGINTNIYRVGDKLYKGSVEASNLIDIENAKIESIIADNHQTFVRLKDSIAYSSIKDISDKSFNNIIKNVKENISEIFLYNEDNINNLKSIANDLNGSLRLYVDLAQYESSSDTIDLSNFKVKSSVLTEGPLNKQIHIVNKNIKDIKTGEKADTIKVAGLTTEELNISTGDGFDAIYLSGQIKEGSNSVTKAKITKSTTIDAGASEDIVYISHESDFSKLTLKGIERLIIDDELQNNMDMSRMAYDSALKEVVFQEAINQSALQGIDKSWLINLKKQNTQDFTINTKDGDDFTKITLSSFTGDMSNYIKLGNNVKSAHMIIGASTKIKVGGAELTKLMLSIGKSGETLNLDIGDDSAKLKSIEAAGFLDSDLNLTAKAGHTALNKITTGKGNDTIDVSTLSAANIEIDAGNGNDTIVANLAQASKLVLKNVEQLRLKDLNSGDDTVDISTINVANTTVDLSAGGNDQITVKSGVDASNLKFATIQNVNAGDKIAFKGVDGINGSIKIKKLVASTDLKTTINKFLEKNDTANTIYLLDIIGNNKEGGGIYLIHNKNGLSGALTNDDSIVKLEGISGYKIKSAMVENGVITLDHEHELISTPDGRARIFKDSNVNFKLEGINTNIYRVGDKLYKGSVEASNLIDIENAKIASIIADNHQAFVSLKDPIAYSSIKDISVKPLFKSK